LERRETSEVFVCLSGKLLSKLSKALQEDIPFSKKFSPKSLKKPFTLF
jgi:hypothetical protein